MCCVILAYLDSQEKSCSQASVSTCIYNPVLYIIAFCKSSNLFGLQCSWHHESTWPGKWNVSTTNLLFCKYFCCACFFRLLTAIRKTLPSLDKSLVEQILSDQFIDLAELPPAKGCAPTSSWTQNSDQDSSIGRATLNSELGPWNGIGRATLNLDRNIGLGQLGDLGRSGRATLNTDWSDDPERRQVISYASGAQMDTVQCLRMHVCAQSCLTRNKRK